jgi:hypothetical protein
MSICIPNSSGHLQALERRLSPSVSTTVVGVVQAADGNMADQVAALKAITDDVGDEVNQGYLQKNYLADSLFHGVAFYPISPAIDDNLR